MRAEDAVWVEKYRPDTLDEVRGNEKEVRRLKEWVEDRSMPNVLLWGPQGTGKTAAAVAFAKDKYGEDWNNHILQMNASDERGIDDVRGKIKNFASQGGVMGEHDFNIILLDEVDNMTRDAQPAMRRIMEDFHDRTRFFLICNYPNKLIDPIQSRCAPLQMSPLDHEQVTDLLEYVAEEEEVEYQREQLEMIAGHADGDARKAIHTLQSGVVDGVLEEWSLEALVSVVDPGRVERLVEMAVNEELEGAMDEVDDMLSTGVDPQMLCDEILDVIRDMEDIPADSRSLLIDKVADCEWRILHGGTPQIQLHALVTDLRISRHLSLSPYQDEAGVTPDA